MRGVSLVSGVPPLRAGRRRKVKLRLPERSRAAGGAVRRSAVQGGSRPQSRGYWSPLKASCQGGGLARRSLGVCVCLVWSCLNRFTDPLCFQIASKRPSLLPAAGLLNVLLPCHSAEPPPPPPTH